MKLIMYVFNILIVSILFYFLMINLQKVDLYTISSEVPALTNVPVNLIILLSATIGALLGVIISAITLFKQKNELRIVKKQYRQLKQELDNLRNISIEEIPDNFDDESSIESEVPKQLNGGIE